MTALVCLGAVILFRWRRNKPSSNTPQFLLFALSAAVIGAILWLLMMVLVVGPAMRAM